MKRVECEGVGDNDGFFEFDPAIESAPMVGSIAAPSSVVADYVAFCKDCDGWVGLADASTPEMKKSHQPVVKFWVDGGYRVELIEHEPNDPMPKQCICLSEV